MLKKIEKIFKKNNSNQIRDLPNKEAQSQQRTSSISSQSKSFKLLSPPLEQILMDLTLNKQSYRSLGQFSEEEISSNLTCDQYQGLLAIGTNQGSVEIFDLLGQKKQQISQITDQSIRYIQFIRNKAYIIAIDSSNSVHFIDYQDKLVRSYNDILELDQNENFTKLYLPDFLVGVQANEDYAYFGTDKANLLIFSISQKRFIYTFKNPLGDLNQSITDIKSNPQKPHRVLITYKNIITQSSAVVHYSLNKNKILLKLIFNPSQHQELGQALSVDYCPDFQKFAIVFSSSQIQFFKLCQKNQIGIIKPLHKVQIDSRSKLLDAQLRWKILSDNTYCLFLYYTCQHKNKIDQQITLLTAQQNSFQFVQTSLNSCINVRQDYILSDCIFTNLIIPQQITGILDEINDTYKFDKKGLQPKQNLSTVNIFIGLTKNYQLAYYNADQIINQQIKDHHFRPIPQILQNSSDVVTQYFCKVDGEKDRDFINYIDDLKKCYYKDLLYKEIHTDSSFKKFLGQKNQSKDNQIYDIELTAYLHTSKRQLKQNFIGYLFQVTDDQTLSVIKVDNLGSQIIFQINIEENDKVQAIRVNKNHNLILLYMTNGCTFQVQQKYQVSKIKGKEVENEFLTLKNLVYITYVAQQNEELTSMKIITHGLKNEHALLVQGFSNGLLRIINFNTHHIHYEEILPQIDKSITCIKKFKQAFANQSLLLIGTQNGYLLQLIITNYDIKIKISKQVAKQQLIDIKTIYESEQDDEELEDQIFILTEQSVLQVDPKKFQVTNKYDMQEQNQYKSQTFEKFFLTRLQNQYSLACYSKSSKILLFLDCVNLFSFTAFKLNNSSINFNDFTLIDQSGVFLNISSNQQCSLFTLNKTFDNDLKEKKQKIYDVEFGEAVYPKPKKSLFQKLFQKNITVENALQKLNKNNQRSKSITKMTSQTEFPRTQSMVQQIKQANEIDSYEQLEAHRFMHENMNLLSGKKSKEPRKRSDLSTEADDFMSQQSFKSIIQEQRKSREDKGKQNQDSASRKCMSVDKRRRS